MVLSAASWTSGKKTIAAIAATPRQPVRMAQAAGNREPKARLTARMRGIAGYRAALHEPGENAPINRR
jgi:hypothetical protein